MPIVLTTARRTIFTSCLDRVLAILWFFLPSALTRPSVPTFRRLLKFPAKDDTFPERDAFDELYGRMLAAVCAGGDQQRRLSHLGVLVNSVVCFMNLRQRKRLLTAAMPAAMPRQRVIIIGLFRTGTTLCQRLLGACDDVYTPTLRQLKNPVAPGEVPLGGLLRFTR